jgi:hypothetical protein
MAARLQTPIIITVAAIVATVTVVSALLSSTALVSNTGTITGVGVRVYKDSGCTQSLTSISWGLLAPGQQGSYTIYVKNTGTAAETLSKSTGDWNPASASNYLTFGWDRDGYVLNAGTSVSAVLTLSVASNVAGITNFSFNITITGTHQ